MAWGRSGESVDTAVCARLLPWTSTSLPLRHLGPGPASVIRTSPASRRFRILNARRKMPGRPSDARCFSLSRPLSPCLVSLFSVPLSFSLPLSLSFFLSFPLWMKEVRTLFHRHLPSRVHSPLAKYVRIFARVARRKYHSSAIPIGARSIVIDFFVGLRRARLFSCLRVSSILPCFTRRPDGLGSLQNARETSEVISRVFCIALRNCVPGCNLIFSPNIRYLYARNVCHRSYLFVLCGYHLQNFSSEFSSFIDLRWSFISRDTRSWLRFSPSVCSDSF